MSVVSAPPTGVDYPPSDQLRQAVKHAAPEIQQDFRSCVETEKVSTLFELSEPLLLRWANASKKNRPAMWVSLHAGLYCAYKGVYTAEFNLKNNPDKEQKKKLENEFLGAVAKFGDFFDSYDHNLLVKKEPGLLALGDRIFSLGVLLNNSSFYKEYYALMLKLKGQDEQANQLIERTFRGRPGPMQDYVWQRAQAKLHSRSGEFGLQAEALKRAIKELKSLKLKWSEIDKSLLETYTELAQTYLSREYHADASQILEEYQRYRQPKPEGKAATPHALQVYETRIAADTSLHLSQTWCRVGNWSMALHSFRESKKFSHDLPVADRIAMEQKALSVLIGNLGAALNSPLAPDDWDAADSIQELFFEAEKIQTSLKFNHQVFHKADPQVVQGLTPKILDENQQALGVLRYFIFPMERVKFILESL